MFEPVPLRRYPCQRIIRTARRYVLDGRWCSRSGQEPLSEGGAGLGPAGAARRGSTAKREGGAHSLEGSRDGPVLAEMTRGPSQEGTTVRIFKFVLLIGAVALAGAAVWFAP